MLEEFLSQIEPVGALVLPAARPLGRPPLDALSNTLMAITLKRCALPIKFVSLCVDKSAPNVSGKVGGSLPWKRGELEILKRLLGDEFVPELFISYRGRVFSRATDELQLI